MNSGVAESNIDNSKLNMSDNINKYFHIKKVIKSIQNFLQTKSDAQGVKLNQFLQALSLSIDNSIFDPYTNIGGQFFITLYELMNALEPNSQTMWYCVDVLSNACKNCAARQELIKNYNFIPSLSKLVGDHLTLDKKRRVLRLIQSLTCGIKISWQIPQLAHLMSILAKWTESKEMDIVTLSMGILVNLCYKNLAAIYTLQRNVDMKKFFRNGINLKGPIIEVYISQMAFILDTVCCYVPSNILTKLIDSTFVAITEAYRQKDGILLRQVVEFFVDTMGSQQNNPLQGYTTGSVKIADILELVSNNKDDTDDPQCVASILKFIHFFVENKAPTVSVLYAQLINFSLKWIQEKTVSFDAFALMRTIACAVDKKDNAILEELIAGLPVFVMLLREDSMLAQVEHNKRLGALLQLLKAMIQVQSIQETVAREITEEMLTHIFQPLLGDDSPRSHQDTCSTEAVTLYVYALALVGDLAKFSVKFKFDNNWSELMASLLENRQIHTILAQAICQCPAQVKKQAIELSGSSSCSVEVANALERVQVAGPTSEVPPNHQRSSTSLEFTHSILPVTQNQRLDALIDKLENSVIKNGIHNTPTSEIMELYGYKLSHLARAENTAQSGLEAATQQNTQLQHRIAQMQVENNRMQQLYCHATQKIEEFIRKKEENDCILNELQNKIQAYKNQSKQKDEVIKEKEKLIEHTKNLLVEANRMKMSLEEKLNKVQLDLIEVTKAKSHVEEQHEKLNKVFVKMEENLKKKEKNLSKKDEQLAKSEATNQDLVLQINNLEESLRKQTRKLEETQQELVSKSQILHNIMKMANNSVS